MERQGEPTSQEGSEDLSLARPPMPATPPPPPPPDEEQKNATPVDNATTTVDALKLQDSLGRWGYYTGPVDSTTRRPHGKNGCMLYHSQQQSQDQTNSSSKTAATATATAPVKYVGDWWQGHWHGDCEQYTCRNGDTYSGPVCYSQRHGHNGMLVTSTCSYQGDFSQGARHGHGVVTWMAAAPAVVKYEGEFHSNQRHGVGTFVDERVGVQYKGQWYNGVYQGQGVYQWKERRGLHTYEGSFVQGKPHGTGKEVRADGSVRHDGLWRNGEPVLDSKASAYEETTGEHATLTANKRPNHMIVVQNRLWSDPLTTAGRQVLYRGLWNTVQQAPDGNGTAEFVNSSGSDWDRYEGMFRNGHFHGQGRLHFFNGDVYEGEFESTTRHGVGTYRWKDGRVYTGSFQKNVRHGSGTFVYANNDFYEGTFREDNEARVE